VLQKDTRMETAVCEYPAADDAAAAADDVVLGTITGSQLMPDQGV